MKRKVHFAIIVASVLAGCSPFEPETEITARPVVQAYLLPGHEIEILVERETLFNNTDTTQALNNLAVTLSENNEPYLLTGLGNGKYGKAGLTAKMGNSYSLSFEYGGKLVTTSTTVPLKPEGFTSSASSYTVSSFQPGTGIPPTFPDPIELEWINTHQEYFLVVVQTTEADPDEINESANRPVFRFRNDPSQSSNYQLRAQQFQYYGSHILILFRLTPEYAALYQNNGTSSLNIKTPYSNVSNGLGIFTGVSADTLQLEVLKP